jgi:aminoglycoside phosphotransferase (APT) family kinase protein
MTNGAKSGAARDSAAQPITPPGHGEDAAQAAAAHLVRWVERSLGGQVTRLERLPRWRAGWSVDVERDGQVHRLYARGERVSGFLSPFTLEYEAQVHALLEDAGTPVPHVYGVVDGAPLSILVMDHIPGVQGLALCGDEAARQSLLLDYIARLAEMHSIPMAEVAAHGIEVPESPEGVVLSVVFQKVEAAYLEQVNPRDPLIEFLRGWVRRHAPTTGERRAFVSWDAAQFLHHEGRLTSLIDFELAHVGDAYMDLATFRTRDSIEPLGDLQPAFERYAELVGGPVDYDILRFFEVAQLTVTMMLQAPVLRTVDLDVDYVTHLTWYIESGRYACDILAEITGAEWGPADVPEPKAAVPHATGFAQLVASLRAVAASEPLESLVKYGAVSSDSSASLKHGPPIDFSGWRRRCDYRLARHLQRVNEVGAAVAAADRHDVSRLLDEQFVAGDDADAALLARIEAGTLDDAALLALAAARLQRQSSLLGPPGSLVCRHPPLQPLPDRRLTTDI